jgi:hypothetical protein
MYLNAEGESIPPAPEQAEKFWRLGVIYIIVDRENEVEKN